MKRNQPARHRRPAPASPSVSLFPFLAVLLCTMGALILLLVVIARQARLQAAQQTEPKKGPGLICRNGPEGAQHKLNLVPFSPWAWPYC